MFLYKSGEACDFLKYVFPAARDRIEDKLRELEEDVVQFAFDIRPEKIQNLSLPRSERLFLDTVKDRDTITKETSNIADKIDDLERDIKSRLDAVPRTLLLKQVEDLEEKLTELENLRMELKMQSDKLNDAFGHFKVLLEEREVKGCEGDHNSNI